MSDLNSWDSYRRASFERSRVEFEARADYPTLVAEAAARGFRRITLHEQMNAGTANAFSWRGGVWVKAAD